MKQILLNKAYSLYLHKCSIRQCGSLTNTFRLMSESSSMYQVWQHLVILQWCGATWPCYCSTQRQCHAISCMTMVDCTLVCMFLQPFTLVAIVFITFLSRYIYQVSSQAITGENQLEHSCKLRVLDIDLTLYTWIQWVDQWWTLILIQLTCCF